MYVCERQVGKKTSSDSVQRRCWSGSYLVSGRTQDGRPVALIHVIGAESTGVTGNVVPDLTEEPRQTCCDF